MHRRKSIAHHKHMIAASSSNSDDDNNVLLGADQEEAPETRASTHATAFLGGVRNVKAVSLHPQVRGTLEGRLFNISLFCFELVYV